MNRIGLLALVLALLADAPARAKGFALRDCQPVAADSLAAPVRWRGPLRAIGGKPIRLAFSLRKARLFAFGLR